MVKETELKETEFVNIKPRFEHYYQTNPRGIIAMGMRDKISHTMKSVIDYIGGWYFSDKAIWRKHSGKRYVWFCYQSCLDTIGIKGLSSKVTLSIQIENLRQAGCITTIQSDAGRLYVQFTAKMLKEYFGLTDEEVQRIQYCYVADKKDVAISTVENIDTKNTISYQEKIMKQKTPQIVERKRPEHWEVFKHMSFDLLYRVGQIAYMESVKIATGRKIFINLQGKQSVYKKHFLDMFDEIAKQFHAWKINIHLNRTELYVLLLDYFKACHAKHAQMREGGYCYMNQIDTYYAMMAFLDLVEQQGVNFPYYIRLKIRVDKEQREAERELRQARERAKKEQPNVESVEIIKGVHSIQIKGLTC